MATRGNITHGKDMLTFHFVTYLLRFPINHRNYVSINICICNKFANYECDVCHQMQNLHKTQCQC